MAETSSNIAAMNEKDETIVDDNKNASPNVEEDPEIKEPENGYLSGRRLILVHTGFLLSVFLASLSF